MEALVISDDSNDGLVIEINPKIKVWRLPIHGPGPIHLEDPVPDTVPIKEYVVHIIEVAGYPYGFLRPSGKEVGTARATAEIFTDLYDNYGKRNR